MDRNSEFDASVFFVATADERILYVTPPPGHRIDDAGGGPAPEPPLGTAPVPSRLTGVPGDRPV